MAEITITKPNTISTFLDLPTSKRFLTIDNIYIEGDKEDFERLVDAGLEMIGKPELYDLESEIERLKEDIESKDEIIREYQSRFGSLRRYE